MFCHSCGNELPEKAKFCPKCGTEVIQKKIENKVEANSHKGEEKTYQGSPSDNLAQTAGKLKEKSRSMLLTGLVACAILIVGIQIFGGGSSSSSSSSGGSSSGGSYSSDIFDHDYEPPKVLDCLTCGGDGDCNTCGGYGHENVYAGAGDYVESLCRTCYGSGNCRTCGGSGKR